MTKSIYSKHHQTFLTRAKSIHGDAYDYSLVKYISSTAKVQIVCPIHGSFYQSPKVHIHNKCGCKKCAIRMFDTKSFIEYAKLVHGDRYDYSNVNYKGTKNKVSIICHIHGAFDQTPDSHVNGKCGCKKCSYNNLPGRYSYQHFSDNPQLKASKGIFYVLGLTINDQKYIKVGITSQSIERRMVRMGKDVSHRVYYEKDMNLWGAYLMEQNILNNFNKTFSKPTDIFPGHTECFVDTGEELNSILNSIKFLPNYDLFSHN